MTGSLNDWYKERQFCILNEKKEERCVKVIRSGIERAIDVKELLVGDIVLLEPGEIVPCDGVFISGHNVKCDESGVTGESDVVDKIGYDECISLREQAKREGAGAHEPEASIPNCHPDCFAISGSKVLEGRGKYVVIAVGQKCFSGRIMMGMFIRGFSTDLRALISRSFYSSPTKSRSYPVAGEAERSCQSHQNRSWYCVDYMRRSHDSLLDAFRHRRTRTVSVSPRRLYLWPNLFPCHPQ